VSAIVLDSMTAYDVLSEEPINFSFIAFRSASESRIDTSNEGAAEPALLVVSCTLPAALALLEV